MKFICLLACCFFFLTHSYSQEYYNQGSFVIRGKVKNAKTEFIEFGLSAYMGSKTYSLALNNDGSFNQTFPIQNTQDLFLPLSDEDLASLIVKDGDTLTIDWDADKTQESFLVTGINDTRTKHLRFERKMKLFTQTDFRKLYDTLELHMKDWVPAQKFVLINANYNKALNYILDSAGFNSPEIGQLIVQTYARFDQILSQERLKTLFKLNPIRPLASNEWLAYTSTILTDEVLNENWFLISPAYRDMIYNQTRFFKTFGGWITAPSSPTIKMDFTASNYHMANAAIPIPSIREWAVAKIIIDGFSHNSFSDVEKIYNKFLEECSSPYLKNYLEQHYNAITHLRPGKTAPAFTLKNEKGETVSLADFKGKAVYIDFWGTSCGPCIYEIQEQTPQLHKNYKDKDLVFLNICVDSDEAEWKKGLKKYKPGGVNLIAEGWENNPICQAYNITGIPHYILIDKDGKIANNNAPRPSELNNNPQKEFDLLLK